MCKCIHDIQVTMSQLITMHHSTWASLDKSSEDLQHGPIMHTKYMKIGKLENLPPFRGTETWTWYKMLTFACFDVCSHHNLIMSIVTTLFIIIIIQKLFEFFTNLNLCLNIFICCWNLNVCSDDSLCTSCDRHYNGNIIKRCIMVAVSLYQVTDTTTVW